MDAARNIATEIINGATDAVLLPDSKEKISVSIGAAIYRGQEKNYSEIFKKADIALYKSKANPENRFYIYEEN